MRAIYVPITAEDLEALRDVANEDRRRPQDQASILLAEALRRRQARERSSRKATAVAR